MGKSGGDDVGVFKHFGYIFRFGGRVVRERCMKWDGKGIIENKLPTQLLRLLILEISLCEN